MPGYYTQFCASKLMGQIELRPLPCELLYKLYYEIQLLQSIEIHIIVQKPVPICSMNDCKY